MAFANPPGLGGSWGQEARRRPTLTDRSRPPHPADEILAAAHPFDAWARIMRQPQNRRRLMLGTDELGWNLSADSLNVGVAGQQRKGKTTGTAYTAAVLHNGPLLYFTSKETEAVALSLLRAFVAGNTAELSYVGLAGDPAPPGWVARGTTPIADNFLDCYRSGHAMAAAATGSGMSDNRFWKITGAGVLAPSFYAAHLAGKDVEWVTGMAVTQAEEDIKLAVKVLTDKGGPVGGRAADRLVWAQDLPDRTKASVWGTALTALAAYDTEESLGVTEIQKLGPNRFVRGHPDAINPYLTNLDGPVKGCWPTALVVAPVEELELFAPVVNDLFAKIRRARYELHREDDRRGGPHHPPLLVVFDDLPALAPDPTIPRTFAQSGGQSVLCLTTIHDAHQLTAKYGEDGKSMLTTMGELVLHRGIRDVELLDTAVALTGQTYVEDRSESLTRSPGRFGISGGRFTHEGRSVSRSEQVQRRLMPRYSRDEISFGHGGAEGDPDIVQTFHPTSWAWTQMYQYFSSPLWIKAIIVSMEQLAKFPPNPRHLLVPPELEKNGPDYLVDADDGEWTLVERYRKAKAALAARAAEYRRTHGDDDPGDGTDPARPKDPPEGGGTDPARPKDPPEGGGAPQESHSPETELEAA